ncbi:hypothetical protein K402DRAFT_339093 [Aulographum hederae CBS 113979]|uniref:Nicotinamide-nucleotide adenylyltransferase n=1 Tax=Aulographum hederae CBS 113979 TaxID=1176131 RepID=A0A6G1GQK4_9PEZI|nr:hypothetical protein K402DRAFT_339093 [Aulographum hederae CBS 113979]
MTTRLHRVRSLLPSFSSALAAFSSSSSDFQLVRSITYAKTPPDNPKTLFVLDSSYNPPSTAHFALATSAIRSSTDAKPHRLLLLFSTANADKAPAPASFEQRLCMMTLFAEDLLAPLSDSSDGDSNIQIDVGITKEPYFANKSLAIEKSAFYPSNPRQVQLIGYDTLTRFLAPKYYPEFSPPLSALEPFFGRGWGVLAALRPASSSANEVEGESEEEQRAYVERLANGSLEAEGFRREWARRIGLVECGEEARGVSSTAVRGAAKGAKWDVVGGMCSPAVMAWVKEEGLYG